MQKYGKALDAFFIKLLQELRCEVQAGGGGSDRAAIVGVAACEDGLVPAAVQGVGDGVLATCAQDVWWQRGATHVIQDQLGVSVARDSANDPKLITAVEQLENILAWVSCWIE